MDAVAFQGKRGREMIAATLFGIALAPLFAAIAEVESENGKTSDNVYQLRRIYLDDVGRIYGCHFSDEVMTDRFSSERVMLTYVEHYGERYHRRTGKLPTVSPILIFSLFSPQVNGSVLCVS